MFVRGRKGEAMDSQYEDRLAQEIDRKLKSLPELQAPATLISRVNAALAQRRSLPWYRQPWPAWPVPMRAAAFVMLSAFFASLCLAASWLPDVKSCLVACHYAAGWLSGLTTLWNASNALITTLAQAVQHLGWGFLLVCLAPVALAWATCLGLGTLCMRFALARR